MKKFSFKLKLLIILLLFTWLTGCTKINTTETVSSTTPKELLTFRITWKAYSGRGEAIQKIVDSYNTCNNDRIEVKLADGDEDFNSIETMLKEDSPVDIYMLPYRFVKYFGNDGKLMDLTNDFKQEKDYFYQNLWDLASVDGKTYGMPWLGHSMCLIYNYDLLKKAGVDPQSIKSIDDLVAACEQVETKTESRGIGLVGANHNDVSWMVNQFIYGFGSSLVNDDGSKVAVNNHKSKAAIEFYKDTLGQHAQKTWVNDTGVEVMDYFRKQQVAFEFQGLWGVTDIWRNGNPFKVGVISLDDIGIHSEVGPMMLALPAGLSPEKKNAATKFISYLICSEAQEKIMNGEYSPEHDAFYPFRTPVRKDLADSLVFKEYPEFIPFLEGFKNPSIDVPVPRWQIIKDQYYAPGLHQVMTGTMSVDSFLKNIETEGNRILIDQ
ncbi:MAG: extracellular solute-binding protein [Syntrophomonadaceae bacterium]|nr:extracellular solute-binding protein [Syntrophomonadaceae bacterium]